MRCSLRGRLAGGRYFAKVALAVLFLTLIILLVSQKYRRPVVPYTVTSDEFITQNPPDVVQPEPLIDKQPSLSEDMVIEDIKDRMRGLPIAFWDKNRKRGLQANSSCARFPDLLHLEYNNAYWQTLRTSNGTFDLFNAYLDVRKNNALGPTVRILGMLDRIEPTVVTHCQLWFEGDKKPRIAKTVEYKYVWNKSWGNYKQGISQPYLISCPLPKDHKDKVPAAVSLVERPCDNSTNLLRVIFNKAEEKKDFAVCVKGLSFPYTDLSVRLAEWIELVNLLGADKIFFYELEVHPNVSKLLRYYEQQGKVQVSPLTLAGTQPNGPLLQYYYLKKKLVFKRQNELIPYNDCFYKHMYKYKYVVLLDIDEVIMPVEGKYWKELMDKVRLKAYNAKKVERASFNVRNVYFLDDLLHHHGWFEDIPKYMHMLQHVYRAKNFTNPGAYIKSFHNTEKVLTLHNHYPFSCLGNCYSYGIDVKDAQLQHYRRDCVNELKKTCQNFRNSSVTDKNIWKFKEPLIERVSSTLKTLGFLRSKKQLPDQT